MKKYWVVFFGTFICFSSSLVAQTSYLGLDGGLEGIATIDNVGTLGPAVGRWTKNNIAQTITNDINIVRSGNNSLKINTPSLVTGRKVWSPNFNTISTTSQVTIQYYKYVADAANSQEDQPGINNGADNQSGTYNAPPNMSNSWVKVTYSKSSSTYTNISGLLSHRQIGTGGYMYIDDMSVYTGPVDNTPPASAGTITVSNQTATSVDVSWVASTSVDGGGYLVVRYDQLPNADNDPLVNGIYAPGNTFANGTGALVGTVVYNGTATNFINVGLTTGTFYYYKVYTYDKAYNYSPEISATASTLSAPNVLISNTGTPAAGFLSPATIDNVISTFNLTANYFTDFNGVSITKTGSSTTADLNNVRIFYDANANSLVDIGETSISGAGISLANAMSFTISGQTSFTGTRRYLVVADVLPGAVINNTITTSIAVPTDITTSISSRSGTAIGNLQTIGYVSSTNDYFRSTTMYGDWSSTSSWESSHDNTTWFPATVIPTSGANLITIVAGNTIAVSTNITLDQLTLNGSIELLNGGVMNIGDGLGDDIKINLGGVLRILTAANYNVGINQAIAASINVSTGGKISVGNGIVAVGANYDQLAISAANAWGDGAIFEHNAPTAFGNPGTYFPNAGANVPIFRVSLTSGSPALIATTINGILEVNAPVTFAGSGNKIFRNGISGSATLTQAVSSGSFIIPGPNASLGGTSLQVALSSPLILSSNCTVPSGKRVTISGGNINNNYTAGTTLTVNGILDVTNIGITNTSGSVVVKGTYRTAHAGGLSGGGSSIPSGLVTLNAGSTVEYYGLSDQVVSPRADYYNITFSGSGVKTLSGGAVYTPIGGTVYITGTAIVDALNKTFGSSATNLVMDGGRFRMSGTGIKPDMDGGYSLTGGSIEFYNSLVTRQNIRGKNGLSVDILYKNIDINGTSVGNSGSNISMAPNGKFTLLPGSVFEMSDNSIVATAAVTNVTLTVNATATFKCSVPLGFIGNAVFPNSAAVRTNVDHVVLDVNSTVNYSRSAPAQASGDQVITNTQPYQNLVLSGTGIKTATSGDLIVNQNLTGTGTASFAHNSGTVVFNGVGGQTYSATPANPFNFYNITNNSAFSGGGLKVASAMGIVKTLTLNAGSKLDLNSGDISIRSSASNTANVASIPGGEPNIITYGSGRFIVERYINVGTTAGYHSKSWQFLAVPTTGQTIRSDFQEGGANTAGYGTNLTRPSGTGYDGISPATSIKTYNSVADAWDAGPSSTITEATANPKGWMVFVRGDRTSAATDTGASTTMRTRGQLLTGDQTSTIAAGKFESVGNPYASAIDLRKLGFMNLTYEVYVWDPTLGGSYGVGGYRTLGFDGADYKVAGGGGGPAYPNPINNMIQSGQAFFVKSNSVGPSSIQFTEAAKAVGSSLVNRMGGGRRVTEMLNVALYRDEDQGKQPMDGAMAMFDSGFSRNVDWEDGMKISNSSENIGFRRNNSLLSVERMPPPTAGDTLHLDLLGSKVASYTWLFQPTNLNKPGRAAFLLDLSDTSKTPIDLASNTEISFTVSNNAASMAPGRFKLVFAEAIAAPLPVTFRSITATRNADKTIAVKWTTENELNVKCYTVQRSTDGREFTDLSSVVSTNSGEYMKNDVSPLADDNYYRIKATDVDGKAQYSRVVKVLAENFVSSIRVYPNPVVGKRIQLWFTNVKGLCKLRLSSKAGQVIYSGAVKLTGSSFVKAIELSKLTASGTYQFVVEDAEEKLLSEEVIIE